MSIATEPLGDISNETLKQGSMELIQANRRLTLLTDVANSFILAEAPGVGGVAPIGLQNDDGLDPFAVGAGDHAAIGAGPVQGPRGRLPSWPATAAPKEVA